MAKGVGTVCPGNGKELRLKGSSVFKGGVACTEHRSTTMETRACSSRDDACLGTSRIAKEHGHGVAVGTPNCLPQAVLHGFIRANTQLPAYIAKSRLPLWDPRRGKKKKACRGCLESPASVLSRPPPQLGNRWWNARHPPPPFPGRRGGAASLQTCAPALRQRCLPPPPRLTRSQLRWWPWWSGCGGGWPCPSRPAASAGRAYGNPPWRNRNAAGSGLGLQAASAAAAAASEAGQARARRLSKTRRSRSTKSCQPRRGQAAGQPLGAGAGGAMPASALCSRRLGRHPAPLFRAAGRPSSAYLPAEGGTRVKAFALKAAAGGEGEAAGGTGAAPEPARQSQAGRKVSRFPHRKPDISVVFFLGQERSVDWPSFRQGCGLEAAEEPACDGARVFA